MGDRKPHVNVGTFGKKPNPMVAAFAALPNWSADISKKNGPRDYYILSRKWTKGHGETNAVWWRPESKGYTPNIDEAGLYTKEEAEEIEKNSHGDSVAVSKKQLSSLKPMRIIESAVALNKFKPNVVETEEN